MLFGILCVGLPFLGVAFTGSFAPDDLFAMPPAHAERIYPEGNALAVSGLWVVFGVLLFWWWKNRHRGLRARQHRPRGSTRLLRAPFPWYGWLGLALLSVAWILAWTRFGWFEPFQRHTFLPLWLGFILAVNGLVSARGEVPPMLTYPARFLLLFPVSGGFWWYFEYLNRFVENWRYVGFDQPTAGEYAYFATLSFSTVLPAVFSVSAFLHTFPALVDAFRQGPEVRLSALPRPAVPLGCIAVLVGMVLVYPWRDQLFPLLWVGPTILWTLLRAAQEPVYGPFRSGRLDWGWVLVWASAGLICGFFWEMWNVLSLAKWLYQVPYFEAHYVFEMPALGYLGYLPFGIECGIIVGYVFGRLPLKENQL